MNRNELWIDLQGRFLVQGQVDQNHSSKIPNCPPLSVISRSCSTNHEVYEYKHEQTPAVCGRIFRPSHTISLYNYSSLFLLQSKG